MVAKYQHIIWQSTEEFIYGQTAEYFSICLLMYKSVCVSTYIAITTVEKVV